MREVARRIRRDPGTVSRELRRNAATRGGQQVRFDNAMAEAFNSLLEAECIRNPRLPGHHSPWRGLDDVERAVADYVDWYNTRRLYGVLGIIPPVEYQALFAAMEEVVTAA